MTSTYKFPWEITDPPTYNEDGTLQLVWHKRVIHCRKQSGLKPFEKCDKIEVDPLSDDPDAFVEAFKDLNKNPKVFNRRLQVQLAPVPLDHPKPEGYTRFVVISDTHGEHRNMKHEMPPGDVLLHCGDFTDRGKLEEVQDFNDWVGSLNYKKAIIICGNHELSFDPKIVKRARESKEHQNWYRFEFVANIDEKITDDWTKVLTNCTLLQDAEVSYNGIRIYGTPWNPQFGGWAFNLNRGKELLEKWNKIPGDGIDILMTHCGPAGQLDEVKQSYENRVGCVELMNTVQLRVQPKYHLFGHIHESYGFKTDGWHNFMNSSIVDKDREPTRQPMVIDIKNPCGAKEGLGEVIQYYDSTHNTQQCSE